MKSTNDLRFSTPWILATGLIVLSAQTRAAEPAEGPDVQRVLQRIETTRLALPASPALPREAVAFRAAEALTSLRPAEVFAEQRLDVTESAAERVVASSVGFSYLADPSAGQFLLMQNEGGGPTRRVSRGHDLEAALEADARARVRSLGISDAEIGRVLSRRLMVLERRIGAVDVSRRVAGYKVFFERTINGVEVLGSRITLTYSTGGEFRKALGDWPSLAPAGHVLQTSLDRGQIARRVAEQLVIDGRGEGSTPIPVRLVYEAQPNGAGDVHLVLKAEATLSGAGDVGKLRVHLVDLGG